MQIEVLSNQIFICQHSTYHYTSVEVDFFLPKRMVPIATKKISNINNLTSDLANIVKKARKRKLLLTDVHVATCFSTISNNASHTSSVIQSNMSDIREIGKDTDVMPKQRRVKSLL